MTDDGTVVVVVVALFAQMDQEGGQDGSNGQPNSHLLVQPPTKQRCDFISTKPSLSPPRHY
uniref:Uncharacterized protein n=1 Tax=Oryza sativa subsp. japonica TaxID=39947 RepID=Q84Z64_ORYSJ|nr:hypothetical protein [Oryza sativa Japonica Group]